jgi:hypothetical protein
MGSPWRVPAVLAVTALALACESPSSTVSPAPPSSALPEASASASTASLTGPAPSAAASADPDAWLWQRYESPADAGAPGMLARPLSPYRAKLLAADVRTRLVAAIQAVQPGHNIVVEDSIVVAQGDEQAPLDQVADEVRRETQFLWRTAFTHRLYHAVTFWVFQKRTRYEAFRKDHGPRDSRPGDISFYSPEDHEGFVCMEGGGIGDARHEVAHPLINEDAPKITRVLGEGVPELFEVVSWDAAGNPRFEPHFRLQSLRTALGRADFAPRVRLDYLFSLSDQVAFDASGALGRALAREALRFLAARYDLWSFYRRARDGVLDDPTAERALAATTGGKSAADLTPEFLAWIQSAEAGPL